jgi:hypothetical protein
MHSILNGKRQVVRCAPNGSRAGITVLEADHGLWTPRKKPAAPLHSLRGVYDDIATLAVPEVIRHAVRVAGPNPLVGQPRRETETPAFSVRTLDEDPTAGGHMLNVATLQITMVSGVLREPNVIAMFKLRKLSTCHFLVPWTLVTCRWRGSCFAAL